MKTGLIVSLCAGILLAASASPGEEPPVVAVSAVLHEDAGLAAELTDRLMAEIAKGEVFRVVKPEEIVRASKLLSTTIELKGPDCVVASSLVDLEAKKTEVTAKERGPCTAAGLGESINKVAFKILFWMDRDKGEKQVEITPVVEPAVEQPITAAPPPPGKKPTMVRVQHEDKVGPVADVLVTVGLSTNKREGLHPKHASDTEYGLRLEGRFFLGSLVDNPYLGGIGVGGYFNTVLGLEYGISGGDSWDATQIQWQVEALYRISFNDVVLQPTIIVRAGYGGTSCEIETEHTLALSVSYGYPYAAMDFYLMIFEPFIRLHASAGYLFTLDLGEDLRGSGSGYTVRVGVDVAVFGQLHIGAGFEWLQLSLDDESIGETSDSYDGMYLRAGWNFH
jgi:opacity protein-like surface antigen